MVTLVHLTALKFYQDEGGWVHHIPCDLGPSQTLDYTLISPTPFVAQSLDHFFEEEEESIDRDIIARVKRDHYFATAHVVHPYGIGVELGMYELLLNADALKHQEGPHTLKIGNDGFVAFEIKRYEVPSDPFMDGNDETVSETVESLYQAMLKIIEPCYENTERLVQWARAAGNWPLSRLYKSSFISDRVMDEDLLCLSVEFEMTTSDTLTLTLSDANEVGQSLEFESYQEYMLIPERVSGMFAGLFSHFEIKLEENEVYHHPVMPGVFLSFFVAPSDHGVAEALAPKGSLLSANKLAQQLNDWGVQHLRSYVYEIDADGIGRVEAFTGFNAAGQVVARFQVDWYQMDLHQYSRWRHMLAEAFGGTCAQAQIFESGFSMETNPWPRAQEECLSPQLVMEAPKDLDCL